jgi:hypothetical protein
MAKMIESFEFKQCITILKSTGRKAKNLQELRDVITEISDECIFHHTCQYLLKGRVFEYTNDFAQWAGENLKETILAEQLSNIDPFIYKTIDELRSEMLKTIDQYLKLFTKTRHVLPGDEFYFNETITLVTASGLEAKNLAEFLIALKHLDTSSIYYHFYEARIRSPEEADDFSHWFEDALGKKELACQIKSIDPFMHTLDAVRHHIIELVEEELKGDMEKF